MLRLLHLLCSVFFARSSAWMRFLRHYIAQNHRNPQSHIIRLLNPSGLTAADSLDSLRVRTGRKFGPIPPTAPHRRILTAFYQSFILWIRRGISAPSSTSASGRPGGGFYVGQPKQEVGWTSTGTPNSPFNAHDKRTASR